MKPLEQAYLDNYTAFTYEVAHQFITMGIFNPEEAAEEYILLILTPGAGRSGKPNRVSGSKVKL